MMTKSTLALLFLCCLSSQSGHGFAPPPNHIGRPIGSSVGPSINTHLHSDLNSLSFSEEMSSTSSSSSSSSLILLETDTTDQDNVDIDLMLPRRRGLRGFFYNRFAGFVSGLVGFVTQGIAADDYEYAELPPPYIPAIFGVVLLAGVGILTSSLGDVMDEEASLGLQSGARAKKEIERSRSSYFGKRR